MQKGEKPVHPLQFKQSIDAQISDSEGYLYAIAKPSTSKAPRVIITVCGYTFPFTIDTGSSVNIFRSKHIKEIKRSDIREGQSQSICIQYR